MDHVRGGHDELDGLPDRHMQVADLVAAVLVHHVPVPLQADNVDGHGVGRRLAGPGEHPRAPHEQADEDHERECPSRRDLQVGWTQTGQRAVGIRRMAVADQENRDGNKQRPIVITALMASSPQKMASTCGAMLLADSGSTSSAPSSKVHGANGGISASRRWRASRRRWTAMYPPSTATVLKAERFEDERDEPAVFSRHRVPVVAKQQQCLHFATHGATGGFQQRLAHQGRIVLHAVEILGKDAAGCE